MNVDAPVSCIGVSACDSRIVAGAANGTLHFVSLYLSRTEDEQQLPVGKTLNAERCVSRPGSDDGHCGAIVMIDFATTVRCSGGLRVVVVSANGVILEWDLDSQTVVRQIGFIKKGVSHGCLVPNVTVDSMPLLSVALFTQLQKYPVDHQGQAGYVLVDVAAAAPVAPTAALPNVKYNKKKQKRLREKLQHEQEEAKLRTELHHAERQRLLGVMELQIAKNKELQVLKDRMAAQLVKQEAAMGPLPSGA